MLEFLVDNIFKVFEGKVFKQIVGISMDTHNAHLLADTRSGIHTVFVLVCKETASQFNFTYRYIDDVLSINNQNFENYLGQIYPVEFEIKDTTVINTSASYTY